MNEARPPSLPVMGLVDKFLAGKNAVRASCSLRKAPAVLSPSVPQEPPPPNGVLSAYGNSTTHWRWPRNSDLSRARGAFQQVKALLLLGSNMGTEFLRRLVPPALWKVNDAEAIRSSFWMRRRDSGVFLFNTDFLGNWGVWPVIPRQGGEGHGIHSSIHAWRIPWMEEPGGLYSPQGRKQSDTTKVTELMPRDRFDQPIEFSLPSWVQVTVSRPKQLGCPKDTLLTGWSRLILEVSFLMQHGSCSLGWLLVNKSHVSLSSHSSRAHSPKSKCLQGVPGWRLCGGPNPSLASAGLLAARGIPWFVAVELQFLCDILPVHMSGPKFPILMGTPDLLDKGPSVMTPS